MAGSSAAFNERILASLRPNFFELLAQEAMHEALRPAVEYLCKVLAHTRPDVFEVAWKLTDEIYLFLESVVQLCFIWKHNGSFSENFYSIYRVPKSSQQACLGRREKLLTLLCLVVIPYINLKLDRLFSSLQEEDDASGLSWRRGEGLRPLGKTVFFVLYPYIQLLWEGSKFIFRLRYLFKHSDYYSPLLWLAGVTLLRQAEDNQAGSSAIRGLWQKIVDSSLPVAVFALKFLEWWYSGEWSSIVKTMTSLPVPPPPKPGQLSPQGVRLPSSPLLCPICLQRRTDPTAIATSGLVFCYSCILHYLRSHRCCPITFLPTSEKQLVRLYIENTHTSA